jgi:oxygen-independent coproporphyrinogen-3 oxidase
VFIGGGTPTLLDAARFARLFDVLDRWVDLRATREVTIEANPESVTLEKAHIARARGVTRVSIGAQSFDAAHLRFLDRAHDADATRRAVATMRAAGFDNLNLDLIFSLPGQSLAQWQGDLEQALALEPDHLSAYNLTFEPGTRLFRDQERGAVRPNDDGTDKEMFLSTRARLREAGFDPYEISNFAGRGGPCAHNDNYWLQGDYLGVGPGASSHRGGMRSTNLKALSSWAKALGEGTLPTASAETLTPAQRVSEALWLGVRRREGVDLAALERRLECPVRTDYGTIFANLADRGWIELARDHLSLTDQGLLFANSVGEAFLTV